MSADDVAGAVEASLAARRDLVWVPSTLRPVMSGLRHVPRSLFRRLPREVQPTEGGERLSRAATEAMTLLRRAVSDLTEAVSSILPALDRFNRFEGQDRASFRSEWGPILDEPLPDDELGKNKLGDEVYATPIVCGNQIYLRVAHFEADQRREVLYCIGTE